MPKNVLSREKIIAKAFDFIDEKGLSEFSLRKLANSLGVQVSSLYNHISNENDLLMEIAKRTAYMYTEYIAQSVKGLPLEESTVKAGDAFWEFLKNHRYLYDILIDERWIGDPEFEAAMDVFVQPIYFILQQYGVKDKAYMEHLLIIMRTVTHGFSTLETAGVFDNLCVDPKESYHMMIKGTIGLMKQLGNADKTEGIDGEN